MKIVESYVYRRAICGIPTNSLNKTFATLSKEIDNSRYVESIVVSLLSKESYKRFPTDDEFRSQFPIVQIYNLRVVDYTLRKLENYNHTKEPISVENYTIEHIMPQKIDSRNRKWIEELGTDWEQTYQKYLHTIGNLTLSGYNPELSNFPFQEKSSMKGGYNSSPLWLNSTIAKLACWNKDEIEKRANKLTDLAIKVWPFPHVDKSILEKHKKKEEIEEDNFSEEDHFEKGSELTNSIYESLKSIILSIGSNIRVEPKKKYVAFIRNSNFADIIFRRSKLDLYLNVKKGDLIDPLHLAIDVSSTGHWGNGDYLITLTNTKNIENIIPLIRQSYDEN
ncbi:MAG: DUF1524 domain-containing protein [Nitrosopumilus sp.]|nr:DUF1524 domain-containing protein [Nitrosopumilus sp.]